MTDASRGEAIAALRKAKRLLKDRRAAESLIDFTEATMPDPSDPEDADKTRYDAQYFHRALAAALEEVEAGRLKRLIITFPPRHGKSELTSKRFVAWYVGKDPTRHVALGTYNQEFADDFGRAVRGIMRGAAYQRIFPAAQLKADSAAVNRQDTTADGALYFVGRGGPLTGRGADLVIIDDPLKNSEEADSPTTREALWSWFNSDVMSRFMTDAGQAIIIQTRWHEDDLVGRLTDPTNPCYSPEEAAEWKIINIPAIAEDNDLLGRAVGEPLWPKRFGLDYLLAFKRRNSRGFNALYQQRPTPDDGDFFKSQDVSEYLPHERPPLNELKIYMASDHAVAQKQENDRTCIIVAGVDRNDNIWVIDAYWRRANTGEVVEKLIDLFLKYQPQRWWAEDDHIVKSIGPFLKKRMRERNCYMGLSRVNGYKDKVKKAQAIQGRMAMGMVFFPKAAPWFQDARDELLKFPRARHDDFVDALATLGRGLPMLISAEKPKDKNTGPAVGTWAWLKKADKDQKRRKRTAINLASL
jgi:predicted phage terminase large subunit-like protein